MRNTLSTLTALALVLAQVWVGVARGRVVCMAPERHSHDGCAQAHTHEHPGLMLLSEQCPPCDDCVHIVVPDDPTAASTKTLVAQQVVSVDIAALPAGWLSAAVLATPYPARWANAPPTGVPRAQAAAISSTRLVI